jgi:hypothetical protein
MTEEEIKKELEEIITWKRVADVTRMYNLYRILYKDNGFLCSRCSRVVRNVHQKLVHYYKANYK